MNNKAIIIGAGPAGLTTAVELQKFKIADPIIIEVGNQVGGIAKTYNYKGNRMDIGGHRFFSKSDRIMNWWLSYMPLEEINGDELCSNINVSGNHLVKDGSNIINSEISDRRMLIRNRVSRIFYLRKFFQYPIVMSAETIINMGFVRFFKSGLSYVYSRLFPIKNEKSLEDFFINRFGRELYKTFFKDYTEKVWGLECSNISSEWGAQRIKGLNIGKAIMHSLRLKKNLHISQKNIETSLIEKFLYPKHGPGQLWEIVSDEVIENGGKILLNSIVTQVTHKDNKIVSIKYKIDSEEEIEVKGSYFFSTMPLKDLINSMNPQPPVDIMKIANGLLYRDFITVGLLVKKVKTKDGNPLKDNWIYIQESDVKIGRLQIFNNWSPYLVSNPDNIWLGLEYFCQENDDLWLMSDNVFINFAVDEMIKLGFLDRDDILDSCILKVPKAYPAYFGTYNELPALINYLNQFENLFCIGRNGMHRYNNQDHSMLTAMAAVEHILDGGLDKSHIWGINTEQTYHEEKK